MPEPEMPVPDQHGPYLLWIASIFAVLLLVTVLGIIAMQGLVVPEREITPTPCVLAIGRAPCTLHTTSSDVLVWQPGHLVYAATVTPVATATPQKGAP